MGKLNINNGGVDTNKKMADIDERFGPYTSVEAADAALGGQGRNTITAGLTVGILQANAGVKEYWYQPNKNSGLLELIPKGGNAADSPIEGNFAEFDSNGNVVDSKCNEGTFIKGVQKNGTDLTPDANGKVNVTVQDGVTPHIDQTTKHWMIGEEDTEVDAEGKDAYQVYVASVPSGTTPMTKTEWLASLKGDKGDNAVNPFKGIYGSDNKPTGTFNVGDYIYAPTTASGQTGNTIWKWDGTDWQDSEETPDLANGETFASSETLQQVAIDDSHLVNPVNTADATQPVLAKAEDVMSIKSTISNNLIKETKLTPTFVDGYYIIADGSIGGNGNSANSYAEIDVTGYDKIRFLGVSCKNVSTFGYCFGHYEIIGGVSTFILDSAMPIVSGISEQMDNFIAKEMVLRVPTGATVARISIYTYSGAISKESFYCFGQKFNAKDIVFKKIDISSLFVSYYLRKLNAGTTWGDSWEFSTLVSANNHIYHIPCKSGNFIKFRTGNVSNKDGAASTSSTTVYPALTFMRSELVTPSTNASHNMVSGALPIVLESNREYVMEMPNDASYVEIPTSIRRSGNIINLVELLDFYIEDDMEENKLDLVTLQPDDYLDHPFDISGNVTSLNTKVKLYKICPTLKMFASQRISNNGSIQYAFVCYLDENKNFLGYDPSFNSIGFTNFIQEKRLEIPQGAYYVGLMDLYSSNVFIESDSPKSTDFVYKETEIVQTEYGTVESSSEDTPAKVMSGWAYRLPSSYSKDGTPSPIIAMLHGASAFVDESTMGYPSGNASTGWKDWQEKYLQAGFVVFDVNGYGVYGEGTEETAVHCGNPMSIETLKKAFEWLKANYNVSDKMFLHGTSMGGALAQNYANVYPNDIVAVALFAPQCTAYSATITQGEGAPDRVAVAWGYTNKADAVSDDFKHFEGYDPLFRALRIEKATGATSINQVSDAMMTDFLKDTDGLSGNSEYSYLMRLNVPVKMWVGEQDATGPIAMEKAVYNAYKNGGTDIRLRILTGDDSVHNFCTGALIPFVADEAIEFFKESLR